jgi:phosphoserine aminotransferase
MKIHNFSAGPSILPPSVLQEAAQACINFNDSGLSLLEMSHRSAAFEAVMDEARQLVRDLYDLDDSYEVLFLTGGASTQFAMVPMNLLNENATAAYANTGVWATGAIKAAQGFGGVNVVASSETANFNFIPKDYEVPNDSAYFHITTNNTIYGTQYHHIPDVAVPLVADMSSDIFSRRLDAKRFSLIYAGAQKNMGPAGTTLVIVKKDLLGKVTRAIPAIFDYRTHAKAGSMYNTPPVFPIYVSMLTMRWIKAQGLAQVEATNAKKAQLLYAAIDNSQIFAGTVATADRSQMNVNFTAATPELEAAFLAKAKATGMNGLAGHRSVGGFRASIYNALPLESVEFLVAQMQDFERAL